MKYPCADINISIEHNPCKTRQLYTLDMTSPVDTRAKTGGMANNFFIGKAIFHFYRKAFTGFKISSYSCEDNYT